MTVRIEHEAVIRIVERVGRLPHQDVPSRALIGPHGSPLAPSFHYLLLETQTPLVKQSPRQLDEQRQPSVHLLHYVHPPAVPLTVPLGSAFEQLSSPSACICGG